VRRASSQEEDSAAIQKKASRLRAVYQHIEYLVLQRPEPQHHEAQGEKGTVTLELLNRTPPPPEGKKKAFKV